MNPQMKSWQTLTKFQLFPPLFDTRLFLKSKDTLDYYSQVFIHIKEGVVITFDLNKLL